MFDLIYSQSFHVTYLTRFLEDLCPQILHKRCHAHHLLSNDCHFAFDDIDLNCDEDELLVNLLQNFRQDDQLSPNFRRKGCNLRGLFANFVDLKEQICHFEVEGRYGGHHEL